MAIRTVYCVPERPITWPRWLRTCCSRAEKASVSWTNWRKAWSEFPTSNSGRETVGWVAIDRDLVFSAIRFLPGRFLLGVCRFVASDQQENKLRQALHGGWTPLTATDAQINIALL